MKKALAPASKQTQGQPVWGRGHCTTALFFLQGEAALCKASPFTTKPARVGKPSPRRSPWQPSSSQREGGYSFLYSTLFAFFMCPVSHTFPAYNGNEMPSWYTIIFFVYGRVVYKPRCLPLFFLCGLLRQFARVYERLPPQCPGTPRVKRHKKSRIFSTGGAESFLWSAFLCESLFFVRGFAGLRGRGRRLCPRWCSILSQGGKAASPASASPWRTPANRCRTRLFSASKSAGFRGSQQPLGAFPLEEPSGHTLVGKRAAFYTLLSCHPPAFLLSTSRSSTLPSAWAAGMAFASVSVPRCAPPHCPAHSTS